MSNTKYLLVLLMEEAAEVIHAAAKAYRFGIDHDEPGYGEGSNKCQITIEIGQVLAIAELLYINSTELNVAKDKKLIDITRVEKKYALQMDRAND